MDQKILRFLNSKSNEYINRLGLNEIDAYVKEIYKNEGSTGNQDLNQIFSFFHYRLNDLFEYLNQRQQNGHYTADSSRELIYVIEQIDECKRFLKHSDYSFEVMQQYDFAMEKSKEFLVSSGGSRIPDNFETIVIEKYDPLFRLCSHVKIVRNENVFARTTIIGDGSYAKVFKYKDEFYNKWFAIKRANNDLNEKEIERFKREFSFMKSQNSPYIIEVYNYFEDNSYTMELVDFNLLDYINKNNNKITMKERLGLANQLLKAFKDLEEQNVLHRDISYKNVLIKVYGQIKVIKLSDFGLVKLKNSTLTAFNTEFKGSLNDPRLEIEGFSNYNIVHETFALTRLIFFILTGRQNFEKISDKDIKLFVDKGTSYNYSERYQTISQLNESFKELSNKLLNISSQ